MGIDTMVRSPYRSAIPSTVASVSRRLWRVEEGRDCQTAKIVGHDRVTLGDAQSQRLCAGRSRIPGALRERDLTGEDKPGDLRAAVHLSAEELLAGAGHHPGRVRLAETAAVTAIRGEI